MNKPPKNKGRNPDEKGTKSNHKNVGQKLVERIIGFLHLVDGHNGLVTAFGTLIIALFTVVLAIATYELKTLGEQQASDMRESLKIADVGARAALASAEAAKENIKVTKSTLRAYVVIKAFEMQSVRGGEGGAVSAWIVRARYENTGNTQAMKATQQVGFNKFDGPIPDDFVLPPWLTDQQETTFDPHIEMHGLDNVLSLDILRAIQENKVSLLLWGRNDYDDIFGVHHFLQFCIQVKVTGDLLMPSETGKPGPLRLEPYKKFNTSN